MPFLLFENVPLNGACLLGVNATSFSILQLITFEALAGLRLFLCWLFSLVVLELMIDFADWNKTTIELFFYASLYSLTYIPFGLQFR